jgi:netrin-G1 ligand
MSSDIQILDLTGNDLDILPDSVFSMAGMPHVQKLFLARCKIRTVDKSAFSGLGNMIELDLSHNHVTSIHPSTFKGLNRLRKLVLRGNPLGKLSAFQFPNLKHITTIDLAECRLTAIDPQAFIYLKPIEVINLSGNRFEKLKKETFLPLKNLKSLELFDNPWRCDCLLKDLRRWLLETRLYAPPTACAAPERLHGRTWDTVSDEDFACRPEITVIEPVITAKVGDNVTLSCKILADPPASTKWVLDGRILTNLSQVPFGEQLYVISESGDIEKWTNLTVTNIDEQDANDYKCVGVNEGGLAERNVSLK